MKTGSGSCSGMGSASASGAGTVMCHDGTVMLSWGVNIFVS